jgi:hypothetical protein
MIVVNIDSFSSTEAAVHAVAALANPDHQHYYELVLRDPAAGCEHELSAFQAPCPGSVRANLATVIAAIRDAADQLAAAHADILEPDEAWEPSAPSVLRDLLLLVGVTVDEETVAGWSVEQQRQAEEWAGATHLSASDNDDVVIPPRPDFLEPEEAGNG